MCLFACVHVSGRGTELRVNVCTWCDTATKRDLWRLRETESFQVTLTEILEASASILTTLDTEANNGEAQVNPK